MTPNAVPATTKSYALSSDRPAANQPGIAASLLRLAPLLSAEGRSVAIAFVAVVISSVAALMGPLIIARTVDTAITTGDFDGVLWAAAALFGIYTTASFTTYVQTQTMGTVGRRVLFGLRNQLFTKLQALPLEFFTRNKAGDLISRITNDTDKLNQFFAQGLVQLASNLAMMTGAAIFLLTLDIRLGAAALAPALCVLVLTRLSGPWVGRLNVRSLQALGGLSGEIQESLANFKVIVAFNRRDYFKRWFNDANTRNFEASVASSLSNSLFLPVYGLAYNLAQVIVLLYGISLITSGDATVGLLIGFLMYVSNFYMPLRQLATVWASFQMALAGLDRVSEVLQLQSDMPVLDAPPVPITDVVLEFDRVGFGYPGGQEVLRDVSFSLVRGRTYALVGPTGGGKTTTAALMARLYDPIRGRVRLNGRDIRSYAPEDRVARVGFILQEPFLFSGTVRDNIVYGNRAIADRSAAELATLLAQRDLGELIARFEQGLDTPVTSGGETISLGQKQLVAFMRAVLRDPELLILDEATANVDTVTEQLLERLLGLLPDSTTKVIIAHRLNTIADADEIFFINAGAITPAGSMDHALDLLLHGKRES